jgi:hypothetical protein
LQIFLDSISFPLSFYASNGPAPDPPGGFAFSPVGVQVFGYTSPFFSEARAIKRKGYLNEQPGNPSRMSENGLNSDTANKY